MTKTAVRALGGLIAALVLLFAPRAPAQAPQDVVKATFLHRFASFVTWPAGTFADAQAPVRLCVIGADPFARVLERASAGQRVGERTFVVQRLANAAGVAECQVVYVTGGRVEATLRAARGAPVLTVTDGARASGRGIIHFVVVGNHVRFHIDDARAAESKLPIDPRLLGLALSVRRRPTS